MKITDIRIDRFGVWWHLALPLPSAGLNVFYGPNEAGKTTLLRFIRDLLYRKVDPEKLPLPFSGALRLADAERYSEVRRSWDIQNGHRVTFQDLDPALAWNAAPDWSLGENAGSLANTLTGEAAENAIAELLGHTPARLFETVFAIGLPELQDSATLDDEDIAQRLYGLSLSWEGKRLLEISSRFPSGERSAFAPEIAPEIEDLIQRDLELQCELELYAGQRKRHQTLSEERGRLAAGIEDVQSRRAELQEQLRGHEAIRRIWTPWKEAREYEAELKSLPCGTTAADFDPARLDEWEYEIRELIRERKSLVGEIKGLREERKALKGNPNEFAGQIQAFLSQREWVSEVESELELCSARARELKTEFEARHQALGPDWPIHRLMKTDTNRSAYSRLVEAAQNFQSAQKRLNVLRKRYEKSSAAVHQRQGELDQKIACLPEKSLDEALALTRTQIAQAQELARLKTQEIALAERTERDQNERELQEEGFQIPQWVPGILMFFAVSGMILSGIGFYTGLTSNGIAGAILCLIGAAGFAMARGFQTQTKTAWESESIEAGSFSGNRVGELRDLQKAIAENTPAAWVVDAGRDHASLSENLRARLRELRKIRSESRKLQSNRRRLSRKRKAMQTRQRDLAKARETWCEALKDAGFDETLPIEDAFAIWQKITETKEHKRAFEAARASAEDVQNRHQAFSQRLAEFGRAAGYHQLDYNQPLEVLELWEQETSTVGGESEQAAAAKREYREARRRADRLKKQILKTRVARLAFLARAGARNRKEFEARLDAESRRRELGELLELAQAELEEVAADYADLAIVENDLVKYDAAANQESIDLIQMELEELESELGDTPNRLDQIETELEELESECRPAEVRLEREMITARLKECLERQAANILAVETVGEIRGRFEESAQPELLKTASDYLARLTCGKYTRIWTTLGEKELRMTNPEGEPVSANVLSSGTREQLYLALRMALVQDDADQGTRLPMVLDDVLVNFDQDRTEAAVQTLIEFAERGHQVLLFTSHVHVARMCEQQGIDPVWLPAHHQAMEHRRAG